ncbi:stretch-activated cation channel mid1 [Lunasporangiospora selenospora]|uniref:Stretch-activated cation channel mid1 n=1 Tax=Lunasporangiospora selenospora TaxID=979761 RepID=A0A9P6FU95_9FUNG|nr:stretch-activated cation channel mid1 [Lunasporangiospora selenospora]
MVPTKRRILPLLSILVLPLLLFIASTTAQPNPSSTTTANAQPSPIPGPGTPPDPPASLPPGTRELQDSRVVGDRVAQGQLQTYHFAVSQQGQRLPVRRQLQRIIFHPEAGQEGHLQKRQDPSNTSSTLVVTTSGASGSGTGTSVGTGSASSQPIAPTRTISPAIPSPLANGTYAVFISISTCSTPNTGATDNGVPPQLVLYVSTSANQPLPGPGQDPKVVQMFQGEEGLIQFTAYTTKDLFFSLAAPGPTTGWTGDWAVEVGASTQGFVQSYNTSQGLVLDDTDSSNASFLTYNFTAIPTFKIYLVESNRLPVGLTHSLCAIEVVQPLPLTKTNMLVTATKRITNADGSWGTDILPPDPEPGQGGERRQVMIQSLKPGTVFTAFFITDQLNQAGAEVMWARTTFTTKKHDNCVLLTELEFCKEVAYAVPVTPLSTLPGNVVAAPIGANSTVVQDLKKMYDSFAMNLMDNFNKVLDQYDCSKSEYSLVRTCTDCRRAYRRWLCSVSIPRCTDIEDVTDPRNQGYLTPDKMPEGLDKNPYLLDRTNGPVIVPKNTSTTRGAGSQLPPDLLNPGDYGEVLPCIDLCFDVVQSCPNFLGFNCPVKNMAGNYAKMNAQGFHCNGLGLVPVPSWASSSTRVSSWLLAISSIFVVVMFTL